MHSSNLSQNSWNARVYRQLPHLATTWPEPVLNLTTGKEVVLRKPTTSQPGVPDHTTPLVSWLNQNYWPIGVFWPVYHFHRDQKLGFISQNCPQCHKLMLHTAQTLDGKPPSQHTKQYKLTCGCLLHPVNTDSGRSVTIRTYIIQEALTTCYKISTNYGRKLPSWHT